MAITIIALICKSEPSKGGGGCGAAEMGDGDKGVILAKISGYIYTVIFLTQVLWDF